MAHAVPGQIQGVPMYPTAVQGIVQPTAVQRVVQPTAVQGVVQPQVVFVPAGANAGVRRESKYPSKYLKRVKGLSITQIVLGVICVICQCITLVLDAVFTRKLGKSVFDRWTLEEVYDQIGCGIWIGLLFVITGVIGVLSVKHNIKGRIVTHILMNMLCFLCATVLIGINTASVAELTHCRRRGLYADKRYACYNEVCNSELFGERFYSGDYFFSTGDRGRFYCKHPMFTAWQIFDAFLLTCAVLGFILFFVSMIFNCFALCKCCSCCSCCKETSHRNPTEILQVTYMAPQAVSSAPTGPTLMYTAHQQGATPMVINQPLVYPSGALPAYSQPLIIQGHQPQASGGTTPNNSGPISTFQTGEKAETSEESPPAYTEYQ